MTFDHSATTIHRAELDREIDALLTERTVAHAPAGSASVGRARRSVGRALISLGEALTGRDPARLGSRGI